MMEGKEGREGGREEGRKGGREEAFELENHRCGSDLSFNKRRD